MSSTSTKIKNWFQKLFCKEVNGKKRVNVLQIILTVFGVLLCLALIPLLIFNLTLSIKGATTPDEVPSFGAYTPMIVLSGSMTPVILENDLIFFEKADVEALQVDDIIAFKDYASNGAWEVVTHRIIELVPDEITGETVFRTKGDYNLGEDIGTVAKADVIGVYRGARIGWIGGFLMELQQNPIYIVLLIGVPIILFVGADMLNKYLRVKKQAASNAAVAEAPQDEVSKELESAKAELARLKAEKELEETKAELARLKAQSADNNNADESVQDVGNDDIK